jgi:hypothetical protein
LSSGSNIQVWFNYFLSRFRSDEAREALLESRVTLLEGKVKAMSDVLDAVKADFEAYQTLVNSTLTALQAKVAGLLAGQLDPAKAQAIDDEIKAATAALTPPTTP